MFFDWASMIIVSRREKIKDGGILHTRYTAEGEEVNVDYWPNFQLDGFGTLIWAIYMHAERHGQSMDKWLDAVKITEEYLVAHWREPSHDWWEEYSAVHAATLASIYAALKLTGNKEAEAVKETLDLKNAKLDASLLVCATPFGIVTPEEFAPTLKKIEEKLVSKGGGVHRHETDVYYGGGEWLILTCFLGWHYADIGRLEDALLKLQRAAKHVDLNGWLPEQSNEHMLSPSDYQKWVDKWGPPALPLLWSHAMFITLESVLGV
jgi:GH15 family glucan-1,4-alpha-glucosidase